MNVTISNDDDLQDVLAVIGAVFKVQLQVVPIAEMPEQAAAAEEGVEEPEPAAPPAAEEVAAPRRGTRRARAVKPVPASSSAEVRAWALENGYQVSDRGRIPGNVLTAYREAQA